MRRLAATIAVSAGALALPAAASAHAVLLRTAPQASGTVNIAPREVALTFSEAVEPRFAIVSITDAAAHRETAGAPRRLPANPDTIVIPLKRIAEGWYLVYWRVISVDGHPVRGAFTFAVGPNPGPAPQFVIPSISETAATPKLVAVRWLAFLTAMVAIGLAALRLAIARPVVRRVPGTSLRPLTVAFAAVSIVGLLAIPAYLLVATAEFALRSAFDVGALVPLVRVSAFGRGVFDLWICFALYALAAAIAIRIDRPERPQRSLAELLALVGAVLAAGAVLLVPGLSGHAAQTSPRGFSLLFDWTHLAAGSLWLGGLVGLLVLWRSLPSELRARGLAVAVPRFSNVAFVSVLVIVASGTAASLEHLPTVASLWQTSYGKAILVKVVLLGLTIPLAAVNLLRVRPGLVVAATGEAATRLLRRLVGVEVLLVAGIVLGASVLSSLPPPSKALASIGGASAHVGPSRVSRVVKKNGYTFAFQVTPNKAAVPNSFSVHVTKNGVAVRGAEIVLTFAMLDMEMGNQAYRLQERAPGTYSRAAPALVMVGHWGLTFSVTPAGGTAFNVLLVDRANG